MWVCGSRAFKGCAALLIAAGVSTATLEAWAGDLASDWGGDCCEHLEERVAELEATTARKGNRKMSLSITGQINRMIAYWDDGATSKTYYGVDNTNSSSRYSLLGNARINPSMTTGFEITIEIEAGGTVGKASQLDEDGKVGAQIGGPASFNASNVDAYFGDARRAAWWIEHKDVGRLTVGRYDGAGPVGTIDLAGISLIAHPKFNLSGGFFVRRANGQLSSMTWNNIIDPGSVPDPRTELVRVDSPSWAGFSLSASIGEAGDYGGTMLRYAGEFSGVRIAAGIGYENSRDRLTPNVVNPMDPAFTGAGPDNSVWGGGVSLMHTHAGLFLQGHYTAFEFNGISNGYWGTSSTNPNANPTKKDATHWLIQGGINRNWLGIGKTAFYGEYGKAVDFGADALGRGYAAAGFTPILGVVHTESALWGLGVVQNLDAVATELYVGYRHFAADIDALTGPVAVKDFSMLAAGARVKF